MQKKRTFMTAPDMVIEDGSDEETPQLQEPVDLFQP